MHSPLSSYAYTSRATREMSLEELGNLLLDARRFNRDHDITGILFHSQGHFFQYLEGPKEAVEAACERIFKARCHTDVQTVHDAPAAQRSFSYWSMAFCGVPEGELQELVTAEWEEGLATGEHVTSPGVALATRYWNDWKAQSPQALTAVP